MVKKFRPSDAPLTVEEQFWARIEKQDGCWEWTGNADGQGYARFKVDRVTHFGHRYSYELHHGPIPEGLVVRHKCDNPPCVNPDHLEIGTHQDNMNDMIARGRAAWQKVG